MLDIKSVTGGFLERREEGNLDAPLRASRFEQDPDKLMDLIKQINQLLEEKERRLKGESSFSDPDGHNSPDRK